MSDNKEGSKIGYMTMTGDLLHIGHINLLKTASLLCDILIIGLTTDELAKKQKRKTWFNFKHRKTLLENCDYVDAVVEHTGVSKKAAYKRLKFNILFIGDDYIDSSEYLVFENTHPHVTVMYLPRTSSVSTTRIIQQIESNFVNNTSVLSNGINGPIISFLLDEIRIIVKPVTLGYQEFSNNNGSDCYNIAVPPPRNWKKGKNVINNYPMISGVNGWREINIC
jgi:glycerol-3-phosphate cytidylyltransferase